MLLPELGVCAPFRHRAIGAVLNKRCGALYHTCVVASCAEKKYQSTQLAQKHYTHIGGRGGWQ